jgi:fumarylacetoacetate (FAA) hydrolase family protein
MAGIDLVKDRHNKMITTLSDNIGASINLEEFKQFKNRFKGVLSPLIIKNATNIMEISDALEKKGLIAPGEYDYLKTVLVDFNVSIVRDIIEPCLFFFLYAIQCMLFSGVSFQLGTPSMIYECHFR